MNWKLKCNLPVLQLAATDWFSGRRLAIATCHGKEAVIAPVLSRELGVECIVPAIETDRFGTFSGEIEREQDPLATARIKCQTAMEISGCDLAIASEGSFGPLAGAPFVHADEELVLLVDAKHQIEITATVVSPETNFSGTSVNSLFDLFAFAGRAGFPAHGLILRNAQHGCETIVKGITDEVSLRKAFAELRGNYGSAWVETDMRAHLNPSRMKVIENAVEKLVQRIQSACPRCQTPGFGMVNVRRGLPCENCRRPTRGIIAEIHGCSKCGLQQDFYYPANQKTEDPLWCDFCNP